MEAPFPDKFSYGFAHFEIGIKLYQRVGPEPAFAIRFVHYRLYPRIGDIQEAFDISPVAAYQPFPRLEWIHGEPFMCPLAIISRSICKWEQYNRISYFR
jgi:hypothetical protein